MSPSRQTSVTLRTDRRKTPVRMVNVRLFTHKTRDFKAKRQSVMNAKTWESTHRADRASHNFPHGSTPRGNRLSQLFLRQPREREKLEHFLACSQFPECCAAIKCSFLKNANIDAFEFMAVPAGRESLSEFRDDSLSTRDRERQVSPAGAASRLRPTRRLLPNRKYREPKLKSWRPR